MLGVMRHLPMQCSDAKTQFIEALRALYLSSPTEMAGVRGWYDASQPFRKMMREDPSFLDADDYNALWDYLADADICAKDEVFRSAQQERITEIIRILEDAS